MHRDTGNTEPVIIEYGFLDSKGDDVNQLKNNWQDLAEATVRAIIEYLNLNYVPIEEGNYYIVKSGDSLWSIAKKYNTTVSDLKIANGLVNSTLRIGQQLKIPIKVEEPVMDNVYVVKRGDTLYKIAQNFDTTVSDIISLNNLTNTNLSIGQLLQIPNSTQEYDLYIVKRGDTLYKIASEYNTTINDIINLNKLSSIILSIGQELKIPKTSDTGINTYVVKSGDTLYKIASKYNTTVDKLIELNKLSSTLLSIGQELKI